MTHIARRRAISRLLEGLCVAAVLLALVPLGLVLVYVVQQGGQALNVQFFTHLPAPVGEVGGGMLNAILGTLTLLAVASSVAVPIGLLAALHLSEYPGSRVSSAARFAADVLAGVPSIVVGIFAYSLIVVPMRGFSALAGGVALGIMMLPVILRSSEELLRLVPSHLREGALALGATRARAVMGVVLPAALPGIVTGILVALARVAGETAPLLFTSFNNRFLSTDLFQPIASLTVQIFNYAISPYEDWHRQAWAGAFVLVLVILACSILARLVTRRLERMQGT